MKGNNHTHSHHSNHSWDILGNLRVRTSDPWKMRDPRKIFEILFWLETSGNDHSIGLGNKRPCP